MKARPEETDRAVAATVAATASAWSPFRHATFTVIWSATVVANIGTWMYNAASGWLMTSLDPDPLIVSLVQVANNLPVFLFALPAGALADIIDKRRFLIVAETLITALCAIFAALVSHDLVTPGTLLLFTFLIGTGGALTAPAWQSIVPQLVPKQALPPAIAANSAGVNVSRAVGPALGGIMTASSGIAGPFWVNAISNLGVVGALMWWGFTAPCQSSAAGGAIRQCYSHRFAPRAEQSAPARHIDTRYRIFSVRQRILGAPSTGGSQSDRRRTGALRNIARRYRRKCRRRGICVALAQSETRTRSARCCRCGWYCDHPHPVWSSTRASYRFGGQYCRRHLMDCGAVKPERVRAGCVTRMGARAWARLVCYRLFRRHDARKRGLGANSQHSGIASHALYSRSRSPSRDPHDVALETADGRRH